MSWELFKKVNKRRGVELEDVSDEMEDLIDDGLDCNITYFKFVKRIFLHIDKKLPGEKDITSIYPALEKAKSDINGIFYDISYRVSPEEGESYDEDDDNVTNMILELRHTVKYHIGNVINNLRREFDLLESIKRQKIHEDVHLAIFVLKKTITELLEIGKNLASLYVRD